MNVITVSYTHLDVYKRQQKTTSVLNISDDDLKGNIYNGSGYYGDGQELTVNIKNGASITGAISATTIKHTTDGGKTQNTSIKEADYDQIGHVMNKPSYNGSNDVIVNVEKDVYKRQSSMFELVHKLDFDYIMNSQALWGCYETVNRLKIAELVRPQNSKVVSVIHYTWNGHERILDVQ